MSRAGRHGNNNGLLPSYDPAADPAFAQLMQFWALADALADPTSGAARAHISRAPLPRPRSQDKSTNRTQRGESGKSTATDPASADPAAAAPELGEGSLTTAGASPREPVPALAFPSDCHVYAHLLCYLPGALALNYLSFPPELRPHLSRQNDLILARELSAGCG